LQSIKTMSIFSRYFVNIYMIAALAWTAGDAQASSLCSAVQGLQMERLRSWNELKAALNLIETCFSEARAAGGLATEAQKVIIEKCGECISSISELWLEGSSGRQAGEEIARQLYARNNGILKGILDMNNEKVRLLPVNTFMLVLALNSCARHKFLATKESDTRPTRLF